jgi:hypothetical protein
MGIIKYLILILPLFLNLQKIVLPVKIFLSNITPAMTNMAKALKFFKSDSLLFGPAHAGLQFGNVVSKFQFSYSDQEV